MAELYQLPILLADANLKAYYRMEAGALTADSSGNGKTLTNNNSVAENASGKFGHCADFGSANTNKSLNIADDLGLSRHAQTFSLWLKMNTEIASGECILWGVNSNENDDGLELAYQYNAGTRRLVAQYNRNGIAPSGVINYNIALGAVNWYHIVFTWTGDGSANGLKLYVNNALAGQATATLGNGSVGGDDIRIAARNQGTYGFASVLMDDFKIFGKVLSTEEIALLYNRGIKSINGLANASIKTINGLTQANIKSLNGLH